MLVRSLTPAAAAAPSHAGPGPCRPPAFSALTELHSPYSSRVRRLAPTFANAALSRPLPVRPGSRPLLSAIAPARRGEAQAQACGDRLERSQVFKFSRPRRCPRCPARAAGSLSAGSLSESLPAPPPALLRPSAPSKQGPRMEPPSRCRAALVVSAAALPRSTQHGLRPRGFAPARGGLLEAHDGNAINLDDLNASAILPDRVRLERWKDPDPNGRSAHTHTRSARPRGPGGRAREAARCIQSSRASAPRRRVRQTKRWLEGLPSATATRALCRQRGSGPADPLAAARRILRLAGSKGRVCGRSQHNPGTWRLRFEVYRRDDCCSGADGGA